MSEGAEGVEGAEGAEGAEQTHKPHITSGACGTRHCVIEGIVGMAVAAGLGIRRMQQPYRSEQWSARIPSTSLAAADSPVWELESEVIAIESGMACLCVCM